MGELSVLVGKTMETLKADGPLMVAKKAGRYIKARDDRKNCNKPDRTFADVLYINGCFLPHPARYRVTHQREQLLAADISSNEVNYTQLTADLVRMYRVFIFFRCPYTQDIGKFIKAAKENNKVVLYDVDDLVIDKKYTKSIKYLDHMPEAEQFVYYRGLELNRQTLEMCDGAVTTTERLAEELKKYVPYVYINRNVASEEMLKISDQEWEKRLNQGNKDERQIRLGYFSGSITHNDDFRSILPVIVRLMKKYENLVLTIAGELDLPEELNIFASRIKCKAFSDWKKLPGMLADVDINLAPLENNIFNEAKSENKWVEAALVRVPTVAANVGAFARMITHGMNGMLCASEEEWEISLTSLIEDRELRERIGRQAYAYCRKHCTSVYTAAPFANYIRSIMKPNIVFIVPVLQISGGILVILKHCAVLKLAGYDVTILNQGDEKDTSIVKDGVAIHIVNFNHVSIAAYLDKAVASLWSTFRLFEIYPKIVEKYYMVQGFETDFFQAGEWFRIAANRTYNSMLPVHYITVSKWCQTWLKDTYGKNTAYAPNGIYVKRFYPIRRNWSGRRIRILVEGNCEDYYKNVDESFQIVDLLEKEIYEIWYMSYRGKPKDSYRVDRFLHKVPYEAVPDIYRQCDILLKSSILESFSYPPLEMMATGGYVVVAPNEGNVEYLRDEENCLFYAHEDLQTAVRAVKRITQEEKLREKLYIHGVRLAKERDWECLDGDILRLYGAEAE